MDAGVAVLSVSTLRFAVLPAGAVVTAVSGCSQDLCFLGGCSCSDLGFYVLCQNPGWDISELDEWDEEAAKLDTAGQDTVSSRWLGCVAASWQAVITLLAASFLTTELLVEGSSLFPCRAFVSVVAAPADFWSRTERLCTG